MTHDYRNSPAHLLALNLFVKLVRCSNRVSADIHNYLQSEITVSQFGILEALYHLGPMSQKELAQKILKSAGNITTVINNLVKSNLVVRAASEHDRRYYVISLTPQGREFIERIFPRHAEVIRQRLANLTADEQQTLADLLTKLSGHKTAEL